MKLSAIVKLNFPLISGKWSTNTRSQALDNNGHLSLSNTVDRPECKESVIGHH